MALKGFYKEVWKDEILRENKVTQKDVVMITEAVGRTIKRLLKENGVVKWRNHFTLSVTNIKGWKTKSVRDGKDSDIKPFKRIYIKPSQDFKDFINDDKE